MSLFVPRLFRRFVRLSLFVLTALALARSSHGQEGLDYSVIGKWRLTKARDSAHITSLDDAEANRLLGRLFIIQKDKVQFGSRICPAPEFEAQSVDIRFVLPNEYRATHENLGLPNPATAVDVSCTTVFIKNKNKLLIFWGGWFFDAVRVR